MSLGEDCSRAAGQCPARQRNLSGHRKGSYLSGTPRGWKTGFREIQNMEFHVMQSCRGQLHLTGSDGRKMGAVGVHEKLFVGGRPMN